MVQVLDKFPMVSKEVRKACFRVIMSSTMVVIQGEVTLESFTLRAYFVFKLGMYGCLRADMGWYMGFEGHLC